jgi:hypothetical protein
LVAEYDRIKKLVEVACRVPELTNSVTDSIKLDELSKLNLNQLPSSQLETTDLEVRIEESACYNPECPINRQTTVYLSLGGGRLALDTPPRFRLPIYKYAKDVTSQDVLSVLPAPWSINHWVVSGDLSATFPRPRFKVGDRIQCFFGSNEDFHRNKQGGTALSMEVAQVVHVGYRDPSWSPGLHVTYVVEVIDGRLLTVIFDDERVQPLEEHTMLIEVDGHSPLKIEEQNLDFL